VLDIGTGSGAIIISVLTSLPTAQGTAIDISKEALAVACENAKTNNVITRLSFKQGDLFSPVPGQRFDAVLSNPPYIPVEDIAGLEPEVRREPSLALDGGKDGLNFYRRIIKEGPAYLKQGGFIALEVGAGQADAVARIADERHFFKVVEIIKDYSGIDRVVMLTS